MSRRGRALLPTGTRLSGRIRGWRSRESRMHCGLVDSGRELAERVVFRPCSFIALQGGLAIPSIRRISQHSSSSGNCNPLHFWKCSLRRHLAGRPRGNERERGGRKRKSKQAAGCIKSTCTNLHMHHALRRKFTNQL